MLSCLEHCHGQQPPARPTPTATACANTDDKVASIDPDFEKLEKLRAERAARYAQNKARIQPFLDALQASTDQQSFSTAADELALWIIGEGCLPEGLDAPLIRDSIQDAYLALPRKKFRCEPTRDNNGVCLCAAHAAIEPRASSLISVVANAILAQSIKPAHVLTRDGPHLSQLSWATGG